MLTFVRPNACKWKRSEPLSCEGMTIQDDESEIDGLADPNSKDFENFLESLTSKESNGMFNFDHVTIENSVINFNLPPR